eukprot:PhF_6_TR29282/c1_g1_i1/m.42903/K17822/DCUN1D1_2; DCN1-like protein 1/2
MGCIVNKEAVDNTKNPKNTQSNNANQNPSTSQQQHPASNNTTASGAHNNKETSVAPPNERSSPTGTGSIGGAASPINSGVHAHGPPADIGPYVNEIYYESTTTPDEVKACFTIFLKGYDKAAGVRDIPEVCFLRKPGYADRTEITARYHFKNVVSLFEKYQQHSIAEGGPKEAGKFHVGGFIPLAEDLGIDLHTDTLSLLVLSHIFKCKGSWEMSLDEFVQGMNTAKSYTITSLKDHIAKNVIYYTSTAQCPTTSEAFRNFYKFVFYYNRQANARYVETSVAVSLWKPILTGRWDDADAWCKYLSDEATNVRYKTISPDQWMQLLEYVVVLEGRSANDVPHDATQAWPCVIDDYVEWVKGGTKAK